MLLDVVVLPFDRHAAAETSAIQFHEQLFGASGVARRAGGDEVPAIVFVAHRSMPTQAAIARVAVDDLHAFDVSTVNSLAISANEVDARYALPFHVRAVEVEAGRLGKSGGIDGG